MSTDPLTRYAAQHVDPQGVGDHRPTAMQIVEDEHLLQPALADKTYVITGCSSGIGIATATAIAATGARLYLPVRDVAKGTAALGDLVTSGRAELLEMDMLSLDSVRAAAAAIRQKSGGAIHGLICNAGVMAMPYTKSADGWEAQFATNHLAHFALFQELLPALLASATPAFPSRVVVVSSGSGHRAGEVRFGDFNFEDQARGDYHPWVAYGQSKTANIYMATEIERRFGAGSGLDKIHANALHPGGIWSGLHKFVPAALMEQLKKVPDVDRFMKSPEQGAATTVWAALAEVWKHQGGQFLEDCQVGKPYVATANSSKGAHEEGYLPYAMDADKAGRLWEESLKIVGRAADNV